MVTVFCDASVTRRRYGLAICLISSGVLYKAFLARGAHNGITSHQGECAAIRLARSLVPADARIYNDNKSACASLGVLHVSRWHVAQVQADRLSKAASDRDQAVLRMYRRVTQWVEADLTLLQAPITTTNRDKGLDLFR